MLVTYAFSHKKCVSLSLLVNVFSCMKPLVIAHMDEDFVIEFKRILKSRKSRKVGIDSNAEGNKFDEDSRIMPESRKYYCKTDEDEFNIKTEESTV